MREKEIIKKIKTYLEIENDGFSGHLESETVQGILDLYNKQKEEIKELKEDNKSYKYILDMQNKREYKSKFLKDFQKENGKNMLPDHDEIYKRYDKQKEEINKLKLEIKQKDIMVGAFKNALGSIVLGQKWCKDIEGGKTLIIKLEKDKEK